MAGAATNRPMTLVEISSMRLSKLLWLKDPLPIGRSR
jgi:hypothetical protein